jgi:opacity protein-like surface antigen
MNRFKLPHVLLPATLLFGLAATPLRALDSGWKLGFDVGPTWVQNQNIQTEDLFVPGVTHTTTLTFKTGYRLDLDAGYQFCRYFSLEGELGYINNPVDITSSSGASSSSTSFYQVPAMVDGVFTLPWFGILKPYAGAGLGAVWTGANDLRDVNGAGQILAGLKLGLPAGVDAAIGYKLLVTTEHDWGDILDTTQGTRTVSQSVVAAVTIKF